jgi:DNA-binding transcriptional regulator YbjK
VNETDSTIEYQGRKTQRLKGEQRRVAILQATLRIISRDGVKAVKHRAVAKEAGVPLAATTYYFKQLSDLINDAFNLFVENSQSNQNQLQQQSFAAIESFSHKELTEPENKKKLIDMLVTFLTNHVEGEVSRISERIIENAFRFEATINPQLSQLVHLLNENNVANIINFYRLFGSDDPQADATILHSVILQLEYQNIINQNFDQAATRRTLSRCINNSL